MLSGGGAEGGQHLRIRGVARAEKSLNAEGGSAIKLFACSFQRILDSQ